jgi:hypothetical protein
METLSSQLCRGGRFEVGDKACRRFIPVVIGLSFGAWNVVMLSVIASAKLSLLVRLVFESNSPAKPKHSRYQVFFVSAIFSGEFLHRF